MTEKSENSKWFVFTEESQKGPLSWDTITTNLETGDLSHDDWVWTSGMKGWRTLDEVLFEKCETRKTPAFLPAPETKTPRPLQSSNPNRNFLTAAEPLEAKRSFSFTRKFWWQTGTGIFLAVLVATGVWLNHEQQILSRLSHELPAEELTTARNFFRQPRLHGPRYSVSIALGNALMPEFYVFARVDDHTEVDATLTGGQGQLLGRIRYEKTQILTVVDSWVKSKPFSDDASTPLPRGVYTLTIRRHLNHEPLVRRTWFLGGPRDELFENELKKYNTRLAEKGRAEQTELRQLLTSLEAQLSDTNRVFHETAKKSTARMPAWDATHADWLVFQNQLSSSVKNYTRPLNREVLHDPLFEQLASLEQDVRALHEKQGTLLAREKWTSLELTPVLDSETQLQSKLIELQNRIQQLEVD